MWVGLELSYHAVYTNQKLFPRHLVKPPVYAVGVDQALSALESKLPEAADWYRTHRPDLVGKDLIVEASCAEVLTDLPNLEQV